MEPQSEAMSLGITSIEVDTWFKNDTLLAGHETKDLWKGKTFKDLYLDPLYKMLERSNGNISERLNNWESDDWKGVFPLEPRQELMLMIDVVSDLSSSFSLSLLFKCFELDMCILLKPNPPLVYVEKRPRRYIPEKSSTASTPHRQELSHRLS